MSDTLSPRPQCKTCGTKKKSVHHFDIITDDKEANNICTVKNRQNSELIASAPELLEALIEALDQLQSWNPESEDTFTIKRVKEVISKAKGE